MKIKIIKVKKDTHTKLKKLKRLYDYDSFDSLIKKLIEADRGGIK